MYASDIKPGQSVEGVFMALRKSLPIDRAGKRFLALTLSDRTGRLESRLWDGAESTAEGFQASDYVRVRGQAQSYHGRLQIRLESVEPVDITELDLPPSEFISESAKPANKMLAELRSIIAKIEHAGLRSLITSFLEDPDLGPRFARAPAAQSIHHAWIGGLLEHTLSVMRLCERLCDHYPQVDRDLVLAGAFLHDLGKLDELTYEDTLGYTDAGRLVGHLVICCQWIHERTGTISNLPRPLVDRLVHIVASHHGNVEHGSIREPQTLEALLVHSADMLDARMASWVELLEEAGPDGWTDFSRVYDRQLFRGGSDTSTSPTPSRKRKRKRRKIRGEKEPAGEHKESQGAGRSSREASERKSETTRGGRRPSKDAKERNPRKPRSERGEKAGPRAEDTAARSKKPTLTFNPFAKLKDHVEEPPRAEKEARAVPEKSDGPDGSEAREEPGGGAGKAGDGGVDQGSIQPDTAGPENTES